MTLGVSGTGWPSRRTTLASGSTRKGPKAYEGRPLVIRFENSLSGISALLNDFVRCRRSLSPHERRRITSLDVSCTQRRERDETSSESVSSGGNGGYRYAAQVACRTDSGGSRRDHRSENPSTRDIASGPRTTASWGDRDDCRKSGQR